ncbi:hypothetical protein J4Q44_G00173970 [Coregonus suidteri]|uniref:Uncharacterized protein n=1 Tax=Coregonus suidteri TaxID=861788 RepID=A0AAN8QUX5_9TELE
MSRLQDEFELEKSVRAFILKKGKELDDEDRTCLQTDQAVKNVVQRLTAEEREPQVPPAQQPRRGSRHPEDDNDIKELGERLRVLPLTEKNKRMFDNAQRHLTPSVLPQFACQTCDKDWWRRVPQRKRVSRCHLCKKKYDPVPYDKMGALGGWIWAPPCYSCRTLVTPTEILPPRKGVVGIVGPRKPIPHSCLAEDCYNRQEPHVPGTECVHPRSRQRNRKPRVVNPSSIHISSAPPSTPALSQEAWRTCTTSSWMTSERKIEEDNSSGSSSS